MTENGLECEFLSNDISKHFLDILFLTNVGLSEKHDKPIYVQIDWVGGK